MRTIIAASRGFKTAQEVEGAVASSGIDISETILAGLETDKMVEEAIPGVPRRRYDVKNSASRAAMLNRAGAAIIVSDGEDPEIMNLIDAINGTSSPIDVFIDLKAAEVQLTQGEINE